MHYFHTCSKNNAKVSIFFYTTADYASTVCSFPYKCLNPND